MNTNFYALEVCGAAHDAEQLQAMRQAQLPCFLRRCTDLTDLLEMVTGFFRQPTRGITKTAAANA